MKTFIEIILGLAAFYCGAMWATLLVDKLFAGPRGTFDDDDHVERYTFHLGLCMILALGFLGLLLK